MLHIQKNGGDWDYQIRTVEPHHPAGGVGKHVASANKYLIDVESNSNLLAAAPDLLEVCEKIAATVDGLDMNAELWEDLHAAIAKAEGN